MDHLAIAGADAGSDGICGFKHHDFAPLQRQRPGHGQTDHPRTNDDGVYAINFRILSHHHVFAFKSVNETRRNWAQYDDMYFLQGPLRVR